MPDIIAHAFKDALYFAYSAVEHVYGTQKNP
jgi:hypothetical protein